MEPRRWARFPVSIHVSEEIHASPELSESIQRSLRFWSERAEKELFRLEGPHPTPDSAEETPVNLIHFAASWPWPSQEKGRTLVVTENGAIVRSVIAFRRDDHWCHTDCGQFPGSVRFLTIAAHELGHVLGMSHTGGKADLMNPVVRQDLDLHEMSLNLEELRALTR
ncbi:MAG: matrixin family metalloprotease [Bdellovibrionales bacterium]|nr:matrixin family metalloprotease [Bdellovibrionales bacterium]